MTSEPTPTVSERASRLLIGGALLLFLAFVLTRLVWRTRHAIHVELRPILDFSQENSLGTWLTVCATFVLGLLCCALARARRAPSLHLVGALFLLLSADDQVMLHEQLGIVAFEALGKPTVYAWLLIVAPFFVLAGAAAFWRLWRETAGDARARRRLVLGFVCLGLALALEAVENQLVNAGGEWRGFPRYLYVVGFEETLELIGPALLIACVGSRLERG
jgi:hypothetical protein